MKPHEPQKPMPPGALVRTNPRVMTAPERREKSDLRALLEFAFIVVGLAVSALVWLLR